MVKFSIPHLIFIKKYDIMIKKTLFYRTYARFSGESAFFLLFHCYQRTNTVKSNAPRMKTSPRVIKNRQFDL